MQMRTAACVQLPYRGILRVSALEIRYPFPPCWGCPNCLGLPRIFKKIYPTNSVPRHLFCSDAFLTPLLVWLNVFTWRILDSVPGFCFKFPLLEVCLPPQVWSSWDWGSDPCTCSQFHHRRCKCGYGREVHQQLNVVVLWNSHSI
jgi:hypothetical protein